MPRLGCEVVILLRKKDEFSAHFLTRALSGCGNEAHSGKGGHCCGQCTGVHRRVMCSFDVVVAFFFQYREVSFWAAQCVSLLCVYLKWHFLFIDVAVSKFWLHLVGPLTFANFLTMQ